MKHLMTCATAFVVTFMLVIVPAGIVLSDEPTEENDASHDKAYVEKAQYDAEKAKAEAQKAMAEAEKAVAEAEAAIEMAQSKKKQAEQEKASALNKMLKAGYFPDDITLTSEDKSSTAVFSHQKHAQREKLKCIECHPNIFIMKVGEGVIKKGQLTMEEMKKGKYCGNCHNGGKAFDLKDLKHCRRCHPKK